ncbi:MAG: sugar ABC transporter permease [Actinobacteria bacterium]|nr:sugar ABC transporter permease [Actinomycetota bacterium]
MTIALRFKNLRAMSRYLYLMPAVILVSLIVIYPIISNIINSLQTDKRLLMGVVKPAFVGLSNFINAWKEGLFQVSLKNSLLFTISSVAIAFVLGLIISILLNRVKRFRVFYRVLIVVPWVISPMVAAFSWKFLFNDSFGLINYFLLKIGLIHEKIVWLGSFKTAFMALTIANIWRIFPFITIMLLAGLQSVSKDIEEAAEIDGAGPVQKYIHILLPQMKHVIIIVILLQFIWNFNEFTVIQTLTQGGPADSTVVVPVLIHKLGFKYWRAGTASALSLILSIIILTLSLLYLRIVGRKGDD